MTQHSAWLPTFHRVDLDFVELEGDNIVHGTRHQLLELCREHHIHRRAITPFETRLGRGHVIQGTGSRRTNTVCLLNEDLEWGHYRIRPPFLGYEPFMQFWELEKFLSQLADDYPEGSPTRALTDALTEVGRLWMAAKRAGRSHIDTRDIDQALAVRLNPHVHAWLYPLTAHDHHEQQAEFDEETGRYTGSRHLR
ncbi:hypothetical protein ACOZ38_25585 [Sphaerisporangium viridialbum]|uniref:hypothetical protein n=1 Tax=Sphaerisporangium viridialbum TaxID=46189 RepID=UPI003C7368CC